MIILCNSQRDGGLVRSVLTRYQLPAAQVAYQKPSKILRCFDALVSLTRAPSIAAVLTTLQLKTYPTLISEAYVQYLTQFVFDLNDLCKPVFTHVQQALESNTLLNIIEKENLLRLKPVIYIAMLIAYALLLPHIGFIISSLLLANGILLYFGTRKWWFYAIASANVIVAYFAFQAMSVTLP